MTKFNYLIQGIDTIECSYYLMRSDDCQIDFTKLSVEKEILKISKAKHGATIKLGDDEFLLSSHGSKSGFPFIIENENYIIQFGEFNKPNFFVKYRSVALWHHGLLNLHNRFLEWAASVGMTPFRHESIARVDFAFDYQIPEVDFDLDSFVTTARKDNQHRKSKKVQTYTFGSDQIVLRMYNKTDEIEEASHKTWFYDLWGTDKNVWRIEWQLRKVALKFMGIESISDLNECQGDMLRMLVKDSTLRAKSNDSNRSRWGLHPIWQDLTARINQIQGLGVVRSLNQTALLDERFTRIVVSIYGYLKRIAAIDVIYSGNEKSFIDEVLIHLQNRVMELHDPLTWQTDVDRRVKEMRLRDW